MELFGTPVDNNPVFCMEKNPALLDSCMEAILQDFQPAATRAEADDFMTTAQIVQAIEDHTGEHFEIKAVHAYMGMHGYSFGLNSYKNIEWFLANKN